ncbi:MAG: heavy metal translocating P-type ATPase [Theionarchaea archaeon]|nr:heavy metal translocating P-type ATPase [Theionarchaea archaeon]
MEKYTLQGLTCADCAANLEKELSELKSVTSVHINFATSTLSIECDNINEVKRRIREIEPDITLSESDSEINIHKNLFLIIISSSIFLIGLIFKQFLHDFPFSWPEYTVFMTAYVLAGGKVLKKAFTNIVGGHIFDENFLMTIATAGAIVIHQLPEAVGVMLFFSVGEYLESLSVNRSRRSIRALLGLRPDYAMLVRGETVKKVNPNQVSVGDLIMVEPGERIPLDGIIREGMSMVDTSALTGESLPRNVNSGDEVLAGYINESGVIIIETTREFGESSISRILDLVENASARKAESEKFITRFARVYTPFVVAAAVVVAGIPPLILDTGFYDWVYRALVLLVISCPCALVISIPLGYFGGIGKASREGILVKGANFLDALTQLNAFVFDKTGTLSQGVFKVIQVVPANGFTEEEVLEYAALTETHSHHPIGRSIVEAYSKKKVIELSHDGTGKDTVGGNSNTDFNFETTEYEEVSARGVKARINGKLIFVGNDRQLHEEFIDHDTCYVEGTVAHVTVDSVYAGYILISDEVKPDAEKTVSALKSMGITVVMLTGDGKDAAQCIAQRLGIRKFFCELLPEDKVEKLEEMEKDVKSENGGKIAFVGDGINDAPVLARADVGVAMGALGSDAAVETADIVIMTDNLYKVVEAVHIARKTSRIIWENIVIVLGIKSIFIVFGILGMATMWEAVFADVGVALVAVFNATRILGS